MPPLSLREGCTVLAPYHSPGCAGRFDSRILLAALASFEPPRRMQGSRETTQGPARSRPLQSRQPAQIHCLEGPGDSHFLTERDRMRLAISARISTGTPIGVVINRPGRLPNRPEL